MLNIFEQLLPILGIGVVFASLYSIVLWLSSVLNAKDEKRKENIKEENSKQNSSKTKNEAETYSVGVSTPTEFSRAKFEA